MNWEKLDEYWEKVEKAFTRIAIPVIGIIGAYFAIHTIAMVINIAKP